MAGPNCNEKNKESTSLSCNEQKSKKKYLFFLSAKADLIAALSYLSYLSYLRPWDQETFKYSLRLAPDPTFLLLILLKKFTTYIL